MKKFSRYYGLLVGLLLLQVSCYKDQGNYDYTSIADITIGGIEEEYTVVSGVDSLKISPQINTAFPAEEMSYVWELWSPKSRDTISYERDLVYPVELATGDYTLYYYVTHKGSNGGKGTGYFRYSSMDVKVKTEFSEGFYVLKETATGNTELDLLLMDNRSRHDLITRLYQQPLEGKPRDLSILYGRQMIDPATDRLSNQNSLGVITYSGAVNIFRGKDLYRAFDHNSMFFNKPAGDVPIRFNSGGTGSEYYSSTGMYMVPCGVNGSGYYGYAEPGEAGASDLGGYHRESLTWFYWNERTRSINFTSASGVNGVLRDTEYAQQGRPQIPTTDLNYDCLYISNGKEDIYILFRDRNDRSLLLYEVDADTYDSAPYVRNVYRFGADHLLGKASYFTSYEMGIPRYLYFVVDNVLYYMDLKTIDTTTGKPAFVYRPYALDLPATEQIGYIAHQHFRMVGPAPLFNYLLVATQQGNQYRIYMYDISVGGLPFGSPVRTMTGTGKLKSVKYLGQGSYRLLDIIMRSGADLYSWNR